MHAWESERDGPRQPLDCPLRSLSAVYALARTHTWLPSFQSIVKQQHTPHISALPTLMARRPPRYALTHTLTRAHAHAHTHALCTTTATAGPRRSFLLAIQLTQQYRCRRGLLYTRLLHLFCRSARWRIIPSPSPLSVVVQRGRALLRFSIRFEPFGVSVLRVFSFYCYFPLFFHPCAPPFCTDDLRLVRRLRFQTYEYA